MAPGLPTSARGVHPVVIYSVYNYGTHGYDYFETVSDNVTHAPVPPKAKDPSSLGATADQAAWPLPSGARKVGSGPVARGRIASSARSVGLGGVGDLMDFNALDVVVAGVALWLMLKPKKRSS